jgi:exonuclease SbcD
MKPIAIIFNDIHLKPGNEEQVLESTVHLLQYAKLHNIDKLIFAGDLFESRAFQRQNVLTTFNKMLNLIHESGCTLYLFPGNHDKTEYASFDSFLEGYRFHPNVIFNKEISVIDIEGVSITLLPFFADSMLIPMIEEAKGTDVLISHFEMKGSTHLGSVSEKSSITRTLLKKWKKTYLGHYHNTHEITKDIVHLPSLRQNDFGEDSNKGFSVLYDNLSYEIIKGRFKGYTKITIDVDKIDAKGIRSLIKAHENSDDTVRFEFKGEESKLRAIDKAQFDNTGIDIKLKYDAKYEVNTEHVPLLIKQYDKVQIVDIFKSFCSDKGYDGECGMKYLDKFLIKQ